MKSFFGDFALDQLTPGLCGIYLERLNGSDVQLFYGVKRTVGRQILKIYILKKPIAIAILASP